MKFRDYKFFGIIVILISFGINLVVVLELLFVWLPLLPFYKSFYAALNHFMNQVPAGKWLYIFINILSFIIPTVLTLYYIYPVLRYLRERNSYPDPSVQIRVVNLPAGVALLGASGWMIGFASSNVIYFNFIDEFSLKDWMINNLVSVSLSMVTFVYVFYTVEYFLKRYFFQYFFPDQKISHLHNRFHIDTVLRFMLLFFASGITPVTILFVIFLSTLKSNFEVFLILIIIASQMIPAFLIYYLVSSEYSRQFAEMKNITGDILASRYEGRIKITSADELGYLAEGINEMSAGLAEKERMHDIFGRVVDPEVRDHLLKEGIEPKGEAREVTVLFTDIRGFTGLSEKLPAEKIVQLLNIYFEKLNFIIKNNKGMVNKFIGDAVMGVFNAPLHNPDHRTCALNAAASILKETEELNQQLKENGLPEIHFGIGIHSGTVIAGTVGSADRQEYTVIGDTVNTASRLESLNKKTKTSVLFSKEVCSEGSGRSYCSYTIKKIGKLKIRGRLEAVEVFTFV